MNKTISTLFSALLVVCLIQTSLAQESEKKPLPKQLTLVQAKALALSANPSLQITLARIETAKEALNQAESSMKPSLDLSASVDRVQQYPEDRNGTSRTHYNSYSTGLSLTWLLFDGFARKYEIIAQKWGVSIADYQHKDAQRSLILSIATAYYNALLEVENIRIAKEDLKYNQDLQETAQKKLDRGAGNRSDVLNFQIKAKAAEANLIEAQLSLKLYHIALANLMGYTAQDLPEGFALAPVMSYKKEPPLRSVEEFVNYAFTHRPDYLEQEAVLEQSDANIEYSRAENMPKVNAYAEYGFYRVSDLGISDRDDSLTFGVQMSWNLYNGNKTSSRIAQAKALQNAEIAKKENLRLEIQREIASQHLSTNQARELADLKGETVKLAEETRNLVRREYDVGRVTATRLNEAQTDLINAQGDYVKSIIRFWQANETLASSTAMNLN